MQQPKPLIERSTLHGERMSYRVMAWNGNFRAVFLFDIEFAVANGAESVTCGIINGNQI